MDSEFVSIELVICEVYNRYCEVLKSYTLWLEFINADLIPIDFIVRVFDDFDYEGAVFSLIDIFNILFI